MQSNLKSWLLPNLKTFASCVYCGEFWLPSDFLCSSCWKHLNKVIYQEELSSFLDPSQKNASEEKTTLFDFPFTKEKSIAPTLKEEWKSYFSLSRSFQRIGLKTKEGLPYEVPFLYLLLWNDKNSSFIKSLAYGLKKKETPQLYQKFASLFLEKNTPPLTSPVFIPTPPEKGRELDHSYYLASAFQSLLGGSVFVGLTKISRKKQKYLSLKERERNIEIFTENFPKNSSHSFIFIDDMLTTGQTAQKVHHALGSPKNFQIWTLFYKTLYDKRIR